MKIVKWYMVISQVLFSILVPTFIGYYIGYKLNKSDTQKAIYSVIGLLIGLTTAIWFLYSYYRKIEKKKKNEEIKKN